MKSQQWTGPTEALQLPLLLGAPKQELIMGKPWGFTDSQVEI